VRRVGLSYLASDGAAILFGNVGSVGLRFVLNIVIARLAGASQMGMYIALSALTFIIARITDLGLPNAVVYFARVQKSAARRCVWICVLHSVFVLPATIVLLHFSTFLGLVDPGSSEYVASLWLLISALATMQLLGGLLGQLLIPLDGFRGYGLVMTISPAISGWVCLSMGKGIEVPQLLTAVLIGEGCAAALALGLVWRATRPAVDAASAPGFRTIYGYAIKTYFGTSMKAIGQRGDRLILSWFLPSALLAAYGVAIALRDSAVLPVTSRSMLLRNQLTDRAQQTEDRTGTSYLKRELTRWVIIMTAGAAGLALAMPTLVPAFYGAEFRPAIGVFVVLSATLPMIVVATFCWTSMLSAGKAGLVSAGLTVGSVLNLVGLYAGAATGGVMGACWGAVIASVATAGWWLAVSFRSR
jgi:O-antigen/teichoic acid export membrane protein